MESISKLSDRGIPSEDKDLRFFRFFDHKKRSKASFFNSDRKNSVKRKSLLPPTPVLCPAERENTPSAAHLGFLHAFGGSF
jgi:hypothetical protein